MASTRLNQVPSALAGLLALILFAASSAGVSTSSAAAATPAAPTAHPGAATSASAAATPGPLRWSAPRLIDPYQGNPVAISCPVAGFCVAIDSYNAFVYRNHRWGTPTYINPFSTTAWLNAVSCASVQYCLAVDSAGNAFRFDGHRWSRPVKVDDVGLVNVSCAAKNRCIVDDTRSRVLTLAGTRVVASVTLATGSYGVRALSCASAVFCVEVERNGDARTYDGTTWSAPTHIIDAVPPGFQAVGGSLSCPSARFCMFADWLQVLTFDGVSWSQRDRPVPRGERQISCAARDHCVYLTYDGNAYTFDGTSWSAPAPVADQANLVDVSCANRSQCVALDSRGRSIVAHGRAWAVPVEFDPFIGFLKGVSCSTAQSCVAIDASGRVLYWHGRYWSKPNVLVPNGYLTTVTCARPWFCVAIDLTGNAWVYDGHRWRGPTVVEPSGGFTSVSCPNETFCAATSYRGLVTWKSGVISPLRPMEADSVSCVSDSFCMLLGGGAAWRLDGDVWLNPVYPGLGGDAKVSCASTTFCLAVNLGKTSLFFDGAHWKYPTPMAPADGLVSAVSCASADLCTAVTSAGYAITWRDGAWTAPVKIDPAGGNLVSVSCVGPEFCIAVDNYGYAFVGR